MLLVRIRGYNLFASEAHFHAKFRKKYIQDPQYWRSQDTEAKVHEEKKKGRSCNCCFQSLSCCFKRGTEAVCQSDRLCSVVCERGK